MRLNRSMATSGVALTLALAVPAVDSAGYPAGAQAVFIVAAGVALLTMIACDEQGVLVTLRSGPVLALGALAILTCLSAIWTLSTATASLRWGLVVAAYVAVAAVGGAVARRPPGVVLVAAAILALAVAEGALGLGAAALRQLPYAERLGGEWRPGGTFEYSSALALLQVMALPALLAAMARVNARLALPAGGCGAVLAGTIALSGGRLELALAAGVVVCAVIWPRQTVGARRTVSAAAALLLLGAGVAVRAVAGGHVAPHDVAGGGRRLALLVAVVCASAVIWPLLRAAAGRVPADGRRNLRRASGWLAVLASAGALMVVATLPAGTSVHVRSGGFLHGRSAQWHAAWRSFLDRPVLGAGAEAYLAASARYQGRAPVLYAHDLPLQNAAELGVGGIVATLLLYVTAIAACVRARGRPGAWLVVPAVAAFLAANLVDWEWYLPLAGAAWALALGAVVVLPVRA
jgi:O-antigen ligase